MSNTKKLRTCILISFAALGIILISIGLIWRVIWPLRENADDIGQELGEKIGTLVGRAIGTRNAAENAEIAADTPSTRSDEDIVQEFIETVGTEKLLVFSADVQDPVYYDIHKDDDETKPIQYAAMKILTAQAYYSVDMSEADVTIDGKNVIIKLPQPEVELKGGDITDTTPAAEYQRSGWSGSAQDGINAFTEMEAQARNNMTGKIMQDELLRNLACEAAKTQVTALANAVFGSEFSIQVDITGEGGAAA